MRKLSTRSVAGSLLVLTSFTCAFPAWAVTPSEQLLPITTKAYISVADVPATQAAFDRIGLGELLNDPQFEPFVEDLRGQINQRLEESSARIGITIPELMEVCSGEFAFAFLQPDDPAQPHAMVALADVTGREDKVAEFRKRVDEGMKDRGATRTAVRVGDTVDVVKYEVPFRKNPNRTFQAFVFVHENQFFATDHPEVLKEMVSRLIGQKLPSLSEVKAYRFSLNACEERRADLNPQVVWYIDPIGYAEVIDSTVDRQKKRTDIVSALKNQGFDGVRGLAGYLNFDTPNYEILHRCFIYAPADPRAESGETYTLAARVLSRSLSDPLDVPWWVPSGVNSFAAGAWDIQKSYEFIPTLVDEVAGEEGFFDDLIDSLKNDTSGPMIDVGKDIVAHLGTHAYAFTDTKLPVTVTSERMLMAIELTNADAMAASIKKTLEEDPQAERSDYKDHIIWEILDDELDAMNFEIEGTGEFQSFGSFDAGEEEEAGAFAALWSNAAISVVKGYLVVGSHVDLVKELIDRTKDEKQLGQSNDLQEVEAELVKLGGGHDCVRLFSRTDSEFQASYELLRTGKMPESEGMVGRVLNAFLSPKEKGVVRKQEIDGSKLPDFSVVQKYLGPIGAFVQPTAEGWYSAGLALRRNNGKMAELRDAISTAAADKSGTNE